MKNLVVYGIYKTRGQVEDAVMQMRDAGYRYSDISVLFPDKDIAKEFAHTKGTKAPEGATTGATSGGMIGGALGLLAGIGMITIPGVGPVIAAGPIMTALAGVGAGGAIGGVLGALIGAGIPEYEAKRYEGRVVKDGGILVSIHCDNDDWTERAKTLLKRTGAEDISSSSEAASRAA